MAVWERFESIFLCQCLCKLTAAVVVVIPVEVNADCVLALRGPCARSRPSNASTLQRLVEVNLKEERSNFENICCISWLRGGIKKLLLYYRSKRGGGLGQSKKSLSENTQISLTISDHCWPKTEFFWPFFSCPGQLYNWHCQSDGLSLGAN